MAKGTFAAGCFWGIEEAFARIKGVQATAVGYTGGTTDSPSYEEVCTGRTGHAEAVEVEYDPDVVGFEELLAAFWHMHDPTQLNRQGPDVGTQYRSAVFTHGPEQEAAARASRDALQESGKTANPIATEITPAPTFHRAEEYHQKYVQKMSPVRRLFR